MVAILNYWDDPRLSEQILVQRGDMIKAREYGEEFDLTVNKEYEVLDVNSIDLITIKNDKGVVDIYTVEYFYK